MNTHKINSPAYYCGVCWYLKLVILKGPIVDFLKAAMVVIG